MASLAQQENQSLSQNIKVGFQYRYKNGEVQVNHNRFLRYTKDEDGHLIIEPTGAECISSSVFPKNRKEKFPTLGMGYSHISAGNIFI